MILPPNVRKVIDILNDHNREAFAVGGCVRDLLMEKPPTDYDVATSALPQEIMTIFPKTVPVGIGHGTVMVMMDEVPVEVSTFKGIIEGQPDLYEDFTAA